MTHTLPKWPAPARPPGNTAQRGITLLESLVAMVVAALGVLGILGSQMRTMSDTHTSVRRAQAIRLIDDLGERLRATPYARAWVDTQAAASGDGPLLPWLAAAPTSAPTPPKNCSAGAGDCDALLLAQYDLAWWQYLVSQQLPRGNASIFLAHDGHEAENAKNKAQLGVVISWRENEQDSSDDFKTLINVAETDVGKKDAVNCRDHSTCHLQYIAVPSRCYRQQGTGASVQLLCF